MRGRFAIQLNVRMRWLALPVAAAVFVTGCTGASPADPTTPGATPRFSSTDAPMGTTGMPPSELSVPGLTVSQSMGDDPALQVSVRRPVAPGQAGLSSVIADWATNAESAFRGDYVANPEAPPELNVGWQVVTASGPVLGIRMETFEFGGASGQTSHRVFYGDGSDTWTGVDLIVESARAAVVARVLAAVSAQGHPTFGSGPVASSGEPGGPSAADLLTDVTLTAAGDVVVLLDQGTAAPYSSGNLSFPTGAVGSRRRSDPASRMPCPSPRRRLRPPGGLQEGRAARRRPRQPRPHRPRRCRAQCPGPGWTVAC